VRVLGIETSTSQASAALIENGRTLSSRSCSRPNQSAEQLLPMIAELLASAGWSRSSLDRIGVAVGPGSFTGLRVGIACANGLALGLGVPLLGVTSLRAMARAVPDSIPGLRCALLDARRGEVFAAAHRAGPSAAEVLAPLAVAAEGARGFLEEALGEPLVWIGSGLSLAHLEPGFRSPEADNPSASSVGLLAEELDPGDHPAVPVYVRDAGATLPDLGPPALH
jgi:tRNA threonylcarbamoyladenosine biosynthesis protein TsaB